MCSTISYVIYIMSNIQHSDASNTNTTTNKKYQKQRITVINGQPNVNESTNPLIVIIHYLIERINVRYFFVFDKDRPPHLILIVFGT